MLATFSLKMGGPCGVRPFFCWVYGLFRFFGRPDPLVAPFGLDWGGVGARFWEVLGSILEASGDNLGIRLLLENLRLFLDNLLLQFRLLLENLLFRSILLASGSGWAGGVTRSAKNLVFAIFWGGSGGRGL